MLTKEQFYTIITKFSYTVIDRFTALTEGQDLDSTMIQPNTRGQNVKRAIDEAMAWQEALLWIERNPGAHPANIQAVIKQALHGSDWKDAL